MLDEGKGDAKGDTKKSDDGERIAKLDARNAALSLENDTLAAAAKVCRTRGSG
jgi:hypothetical protein